MREVAGSAYRRGLRARLIQVLTATVTVSVLAIGLAAIAAFDRAISPELTNRTRLVGSIARAEIQRALELGIPLTAVGGLDGYLNEMITKFREVERIAVTDASGERVAVVERPKPAGSLIAERGLYAGTSLGQGAFVLPILDGNRLVGRITIETSPEFIQTRLRDVFLDVLVIALVAILVAIELATAVIITSVGKPLDRVLRILSEQRAGNFSHRIRPLGLGSLPRAAERLNDHAEDLAERLRALPVAAHERIRGSLASRIADGRPTRLRLSDIGDIRLALFLFSIATEVSVAFLPLFARSASRPEWLSPEAAAALPLVFYLIAIAVLSPVAGPLARRFGPRRMFLLSVPPTIVALIAIGFSESVSAIAFWRGVMAVFYATATIACQEYALRASPEQGSAQPLGTFVVVVYGGVFCGAALGGVVAGRFGFEATFLLGAAIAALSGVLGFVGMRGRAGDGAGVATPPVGAPRSRISLTPALIGILAGVAIPMNAASAAFIWYLTPMILLGWGFGPAEIARIVMLYYLAAVLLGPTATNLSDGRIGPGPLVLVGAFGSGIVLLSMTFWNNYWALAFAVAGLGICHALMRAPLYALVLRTSNGATGSIGALRLFERVGAILGLAATSFVLGRFGADVSIRLVALTILAGLLAHLVLAALCRLPEKWDGRKKTK